MTNKKTFDTPDRVAARRRARFGFLRALYELEPKVFRALRRFPMDMQSVRRWAERHNIGAEWIVQFLWWTDEVAVDRTLSVDPFSFEGRAAEHDLMLDLFAPYFQHQFELYASSADSVPPESRPIAPFGPDTRFDQLRIKPNPVRETRDEWLKRAATAWELATQLASEYGLSPTPGRTEIDLHCRWTVRYYVRRETVELIAQGPPARSPKAVDQAIRSTARFLGLPPIKSQARIKTKKSSPSR